MAKITYEEERGQFFSVLGSTGNFHQKVTEGTEGARLRKYESSDGIAGEKWELVVSEITGVIDNISIFEGKFGKNILVALKLDEGETESDQVIMSFGANSPFGENLLEKLPSLDLSKEVTFSPYSFVDDTTGKPKKGLTLKQNGNKIDSFFNSYNPETKKWTSKKGFPLPEGEGKGFDTDDWKAYFIGRRKYLIEELKKTDIYTEEKAPEVPATDDVAPADVKF
jgi:hypothetical protein